MSNRSSQLIAVALLGALAVIAASCARTDSPTGQTDDGMTSKSDAAPAADVSASPRVRLTTSMGDLVIELDQEKAPVSVANFLKYVDRGFYDGTIFHRVMDGFMIQTGGFTTDMVEKPTDPGIANEWRNGLKNVRGSVAMARVGGDPSSGTSQFYINVVDNAQLDQPQPDGAAYAVFGHVVEGMDVVDAIRAVQTGSRGRMNNVPVSPVEIRQARRVGG